MSDRSVAVFGAGAVGAFIGGRLQLGGQDVTLIGRPRMLDPMKKDGLTLVSPRGVEHVAKPRIITDSESVEERFDVVLLTVKAYSVVESISAVRRMLNDEGIVVSFQNGVGTDKLLVDAVGAARVVAATSTASVGIDMPAKVQQYTRNGGLAWAAYDSDGTASVAALFRLAGLEVAHISLPESLKWSKLLLNAVGSAQCAILQTDMAQIARDRRLFVVEQLTFRETLTVMQAARIPVVDLPGYPVRFAAFTFGLPTSIARASIGRRMARGRGGKPPTLRGDVSRGGPTENEFLNGATARLARKVNVAAPINTALAAIVDEVTASPEMLESFDYNPDALLERLGRPLV